jgi:hypothetical protein
LKSIFGGYNLRLTLFLLLTSLLSAETIYLNSGDGKRVKLFKESRKLQNLDRDIYFLYNRESKLISNGTLSIHFSEAPPLDVFIKKYKLEFIRKNSTGTYIFKSLDNSDIVEKCNSVYAEKEVLSATPNWKRERGLK